MNLTELSKKLNKPSDSLKDEILDRYGVIILSDDAPVRENIAADLLSKAVPEPKPAPAKPMQMPKQDTEKKANSKQDSVKSSPGISKDQQCLNELRGIQSPKVAYTNKFIKYCIDNKFLIFIDTCSLLINHFFDFYKLFLTQKGDSDIKIYVPYVVIEELKRLMSSKSKEKKINTGAKRALEFILEEENKGNIVIVGNEDDKRTNNHDKKVVHADRIIIEKLMFFRNDSRSTLFITQDHDATVDALELNQMKSVKSNAFVLVKKIIHGGALVDNTTDTVNPVLPIDK